jgi:two-component system NtrC family sensor kinase
MARMTPLRVLLVEDHSADAELTIAALTDAGLEVEWERVDREDDYLAALDRAPDVILSDSSMPQLDVRRALELLRSRGSDVPYIVVSGAVGEDGAVKCLKDGAVDFLLKDRLGRLPQAVARALEHRRLLAEKRRVDAELARIQDQFAVQTAIALQNAERYEALRQATEQIRAVITESPLAITVYDLDTRVRLWNPAAERVLGWRAADIVGRLLSEIVELDPEEAVERAELRGRLLRGETISGIDARRRHRDGSLVDLSLSGAPLLDTHGRVASILVIFADIGDRKHTEAALRQAEKLTVMGSLLAGVAHELNNPLTVVLGHAELLRNRVRGNGDLESRVDQLARAATRCARIVRNFLALARQRPPERRSVNLNEIVADVLELVAHLLRVDAVEVVPDLVAGMPAVMADPDQLQQVVLNLVTNAHHAMLGVPGNRILTVRTRFAPARDHVVLDVADTGPGVPAATRPRLFEPFFTTKPLGKGTGPGLSLCRGYVEAHGGTIHAANRPEGGAIFSVELPVTTETAIEPDAAAGGGKTARLLVVDDEVDVAEVIADLLRHDGHDVAIVASGRAALEALAASSFALILTDARMADLDGLALYREAIRRHPEMTGRFVFVTGDVLSPDTRQFLETSGVVAVEKPCTLPDLRRALQRALENRPTVEHS